MIWVIGIFVVYGIFLQWLPDIKNVENPDFFKEGTIIYDADGNEIYRFGENGRRTYVNYENISQSIKDALVAVEDPTFFTNPGVDIFGIARAVISSAVNKNQIKGTSTLSQQLIKNTLLSNERTFKRKVQEAYLAYKLNKNYSKEKILEMYLNAIEYGHGANGVEQASLTFFGKSAKDVGPLWASILASLPKGPTAYSPYSRRGALMGKIEVYPTGNVKDRVVLDLEDANWKYTSLYSPFKQYLKNLTFTKDGSNVKVCNLKKEYVWDKQFVVWGDGCTMTNFDNLLNLIGSIQIHGQINSEANGNEDNTLEYTVGRKDYVAVKMFEQDKINGTTFGQILYDGLEFKFNTPVTQIKYPYFVMYIQEQLEQKYGDDVNVKTGLKVYTTIRPKLQEQAEKIVREQVADNASQGATSASLVSMDNTTGEIIAMVGWPDYDKDQNNMTTALRQPGSSFKPLVYALAISKNPIGPESPVADTSLKVGSWDVNNYDNSYKWILSVGKALAFSRNVPAVKMYFLAGQEKTIIQYLSTLGVNIKPHPSGSYGAPMALGTTELKATELMQAYSVFANNGVKREAYGIKKILDSQGGIIEDRSSSEGQQVFSAAASYIISSILSNNEYRPESTTWRNNLTIKGKTAAAKTGTSNMENKKTGKIAPRDTWTAWYSPNITTVVWAGNVDGSALRGTCDGINCTAPAWNKFMTFALRDYPNTEFKAPADLFTFETAKLSGLLSSNGVKNIMAVKLTEQDSGSKELKIDSLCGWVVTDSTPEESIISVYTPTSKPIIDRYDPAWLKGFYAAANISASEWTRNTNSACERPSTNGNVSISAEIVWVWKNILQISWSWDRMIQKFRVTVDGKILKEAKYDDPAKTGSDRVSTNTISDSSNVLVELVDVYGMKYSKSGASGWLTTPATWSWQTDNAPQLPSLNEEAQANTPPVISLTNPSRASISVYQGDVFNLRFNVQIATAKRTVSVSIDGVPISTANSGDSFVIPIGTTNIAPGDHTVVVTATNWNAKSDSRSFTLSVLPK